MAYLTILWLWFASLSGNWIQADPLLLPQALPLFQKMQCECRTHTHTHTHTNNFHPIWLSDSVVHFLDLVITWGYNSSKTWASISPSRTFLLPSSPLLHPAITALRFPWDFSSLILHFHPSLSSFPASLFSIRLDWYQLTSQTLHSLNPHLIGK